MRIAIAAAVLLFAAEDGRAGRPRPEGTAKVRPVVEIEEDVYSFQSAHNGAGPTWCSGSTCLVRIGNDVFVSGIETLKDFKPLNNCRWMLFTRGQDAWELAQVDKTGRTREPCPMVGFGDGRLFLSANPTLSSDPNQYGGPARPEILQFNAADPKAPPETILPGWDGEPPFTEHSYRSFAADGPAGELILFQNIGWTHAEWSFRDKEGKWIARGKLVWPWGAEYDKPQPIRVCYPTVALSNRAVHFCGVSDIVEPYGQWRAYKKEITGRNWDFDFRRLFYTWTPDVTTGKFSDWVEIASRDKTCGWISPKDIWAAPDGTVHILWTERATDWRLRDKFFPGTKQSHALNYALVRDGRVVSRRTLLLATEGGPNDITADHARFHLAPDDRLFVLYYANGTDSAGKPVSENRLVELLPDGTASEPVRLPMKHPLDEYFTATVRGGSGPSKTLDVLGHRVGSPRTMSYARIRLW